MAPKRHYPEVGKVFEHKHIAAAAEAIGVTGPELKALLKAVADGKIKLRHGEPSWSGEKGEERLTFKPTEGKLMLAVPINTPKETRQAHRRVLVKLYGENHVGQFLTKLLGCLASLFGLGAIQMIEQAGQLTHLFGNAGEVFMGGPIAATNGPYPSIYFDLELLYGFFGHAEPPVFPPGLWL